jgi:CheY-like chemotaxis protein
MKPRSRAPTLKILLVEDEQDLRDSLQELLSDEGHEVVTAVDGEQALARLNSEAFNLVLADIRLPKVDGLTLFKRLKEDSAPVEVILMTARPMAASAPMLCTFPKALKRHRAR